MTAEADDPVAASERLPGLVRRRGELRADLAKVELALRDLDAEISECLGVITESTRRQLPPAPRPVAVPPEGWRQIPVDELPWLANRCRILNVFDFIGIRTIGQLVQCTASDLLRCHHFGRHTLDDTHRALGKFGLNLAERSPGLDALKAQWNRTESAMENRG